MNYSQNDTSSVLSSIKDETVKSESIRALLAVSPKLFFSYLVS